MSQVNLYDTYSTVSIQDGLYELLQALARMLRSYQRQRGAREETIKILRRIIVIAKETRWNSMLIFSIKSSSPYEKAIYCYLKLIFAEIPSLTMVTSKFFREISKYTDKICALTMTSVICRIVKLVEKL